MLQETKNDLNDEVTKIVVNVGVLKEIHVVSIDMKVAFLVLNEIKGEVFVSLDVVIPIYEVMVIIFISFVDLKRIVEGV